MIPTPKRMAAHREELDFEKWSIRRDDLIIVSTIFSMFIIRAGKLRKGKDPLTS